MTNEEFTGHLLASLHGPKAAEIAARVGVLLFNDNAICNQMARISQAVHERLTKELDQAVMVLSAIEKHTRPGSPANAVLVSALRSTLDDVSDARLEAAIEAHPEKAQAILKLFGKTSPCRTPGTN